MLLIDGVKYELWIPPSEDEFERVVKEHAQDIFGEQSIYLDRKKRLKSLSGISSIPDGYVIVFGDSPEWHIVEVELSSHPLHDHIVAQVGRFISGISNPSIQRGIVNAIEGEIIGDEFLKLKLRKAIEPTEIYRFLTDVISRQPILTIIIEKDTEELREALNTLRYPQIKVVEFQTFAREEVGLSVHAHLFQPLYLPVPTPLSPPVPLAQPPNKVEIEVKKSHIEYNYFGIRTGYKDLFPSANEKVDLDTDVGVIQASFSIDPSYGRSLSGLKEWFRAHPELEVGDKVIFTVIEPMKKYRLEIVK
ncbi:MAG: hypothetical protein QMC90_01570 [Dehalococcoidales bacterium]|nr:hypothetical protein [Dehalococcoidales bacterium]